jgi:hypothetical protein
VAAAAAAGTENAAAMCFPAAVAWITGVLRESLANGLSKASLRCSATGTAGSRRRRSSQVKASAALLSVVATRSLVQLAAAMDAAGLQLLFKCMLAEPNYKAKLVQPVQGDIVISMSSLCLSDKRVVQTAAAQWHSWQTSMLQAMLRVLGALAVLNAEPPAGAAAALEPSASVAAAAAAAAEQAEEGTCASSSSGSGDRATAAASSSSATHQFSWGYLLRLQQRSPRWAAAVAAYDAEWPGWHEDADNMFARGWLVLTSSEARQRLQQQYTDTLELCRVR